MEFFGGFELACPAPAIDPKPCELRPLQPGPAAIFVHRGSYRFLWQTWNAAYRNWLPQSDFQLRDAPAMERYLVDPRNAKSERDLITEVVIPIESTSPCSPSIRGRWSGRFIEQAENETRVEFTETATAGSLPSKILGYLFFDLDAILDTYINDLKNKLESESHEQASR